MDPNFTLAFTMSLIAGLSTGIGSVFCYFMKKPNMKLLSFALGCSAGVMIYISFMEMLPLSIKETSLIASVITFFIGIIFTLIIVFTMRICIRLNMNNKNRLMISILSWIIY